MPAGLRRNDDVDLERDRSLVERCQQGDPGAFEDLYLRYRGRLYRFCLRKLDNSAEAEDAVQEAFARAWRALPNFSGERRFYPWLSVIAGNLCIDMQKKHSRWTTVDDHDLDLMAPAVTCEQDTLSESGDDHDLLSRALQRLSERHREVLELREGRNWTYQQIATYAGVEVSTIETLLFRARKSLRREFMALAQSEGALGILVLPAFVLRRLLRRSLSGAKAAATAAKAAVAAAASGGVASMPAVGGAAVAVVASAAIIGTSVAAAAVHASPNSAPAVVAPAAGSQDATAGGAASGGLGSNVRSDRAGASATGGHRQPHAGQAVTGTGTSGERGTGWPAGWGNNLSGSAAGKLAHSVRHRVQGIVNQVGESVSGVVSGVSGVVSGASGVVSGVSGVVSGASGVVSGASGVVSGVSGVVSGASGVGGLP